MIYLFLGNDRSKVKGKVDELVKKNSENNNFNFFRFNSEDWSALRFQELLDSQGLFSPRYIVLCDRLFENKEAQDFLLDKIKEAKESENLFIFIEPSLDKKNLDTLKKFSERVEDYSIAEKNSAVNKPQIFNIFSICDALGERDRKNLWILFNKALLAGLEPEEIFWKLAWQTKNIYLVKKTTDNGKEMIGKLKMSPFVVNKAVRYANNWREEEIASLYKDLLDTYHNARRGLVDLENSIEKVILK